MAEIAVTEMQRIKVECDECKVSTLIDQETGCTLTFDKYLTLFAWLNNLFFAYFAATNKGQREKPSKDSG